MAERCYATTGDYARFVGTERAPDDLDRRTLVRASRRVDRALVGAVYPTDVDGIATAQETREAIRDAVCAVVEDWRASGDPTGTGQSPQFATVSIGDVTLSRGGPAAPGPQGPTLPPAALDLLDDAGLLDLDPWLYG